MSLQTVVADAVADINRITVEFKLFSSVIFFYVNNILIESQWNLNVGCQVVASSITSILIESQWNLNFVNTFLLTKETFILIESQWNLN